MTHFHVIMNKLVYCLCVCLLGLWCIVNNAGITGNKIGPSEWLGRDDFLDVMNTNFFGMINVTNTFLPLVSTLSCTECYLHVHPSRSCLGTLILPIITLICGGVLSCLFLTQLIGSDFGSDLNLIRLLVLFQ